VGGGEGQSTGSIDVDLLAAGNNDILWIVLLVGALRCEVWRYTYKVVGAGQDSVVSRPLERDTLGNIGLALATEIEVRTGSGQRQEVDGRAGASSGDTEGAGGSGFLAAAGHGGDQRDERKQG
jgi:hypothetical protein